jgi:DNA-binding GntR family transcriptional regulator
MNKAIDSPRIRSAVTHGLARLIEQHIRSRDLAAGDHLSAQTLADLFGASRTPVNHALSLLATRGLLTHEPNRGYFVREPGEQIGPGSTQDLIEQAYQAMARDRLSGALPQDVKEIELRARYQLTKAQLHLLLSRVTQEGWIERRAGYGWAFTEMLTTSEGLAETFRLRRLLEPASLLEPGYRMDRATLEECRRVELALLRGAFATMPLDALFDRGVRFHEAVVSGSRNRFFLDTIRRVNRIRRLLSYEAMSNRTRYIGQAEQHLALLDLIEAGKNEEAAEALRKHLDSVQTYYVSTLSGHAGARD